MKQRKLYRYVGRNGVITSPILLEDIKHIALVELRPESGHALTNGTIVKHGSIVIHIDDLDDWSEIEADAKE